MQNLSRLIFRLSILLLVGINASAQENKIQEAKLTLIPPTYTIRVVFDNQVANTTDITRSNITVKSASGIELSVDSASIAEGNFKVAFVVLNIETLPADDDSEFTICFRRLSFRNTSGPPIVKTNVCATGPIEDAVKTQARLEQLILALREVPKSSSEKNIFASGLVTKGAGEDSEGGAELNLNSNDLNIPGLTAFARLKKSTAEDADPKHFDVGLNYRSTFLFHRGALGRIRDLQNSGRNDEAQAELDKLKNAVWSSITFDFAAKFEAEALSFDVANFVGEGLMQIKSRVLPLRRLKEKETNINRTGFYRFHIIPLGVEIGQNMNDGDLDMQMGEPSETSEAVDWIARYKFGGGFTFFYSNKRGKWLFKRVEWDTQFVGRYLFRDEVMFDESTMMNIAIDRGFKPWLQTSLNAFVADTPNGRFGFRLNYNRGSLPPVFADTNSFQFGLVFETTDDSKKQQ